MNFSHLYMQEVNNMANAVLEAMVDSDNIKHNLFIKAANLVDKWRRSTIELIYLMESASCLELDILLDKYEIHLCQCIHYANNYEKKI